MNIASHIEKIRRFDDVRRRMDPVGDFELWFWATMNAGTHAINAALHSVGVTDPSDYFPTQPGVYLVRGADGHYRSELRPLGDVLHVGRPRIEAPVPEELLHMMEAMEIIERHRDPCIRGSREPTASIIAECTAAYEDCIALARQLLKFR